MPGKYNRRRYKRRPQGKKRIARTKKLVAGQTQPTLLEKIASGVGSAAQVASAVLPMIKAINTEMKFVDVISTGNISSTPTIIPLCLPSQGTTEQNRIGNSLLLKDINLRLSISPNYTAVPLNIFRVVMLIDKTQQGVAPTASQIFQNSTNIDSAFNKNFTDRFVIIKDKRFLSAQQGDQMQLIQKWFKKLDFHQRFLGTGGTAADAGQNTPYLVIWGTLSVNFPTYSIYSRTNFTDN